MDEKLQLIIDNEREWRKHLYESVAEIKKLLKQQNGRIGKTELKLARFIGFGACLVLIIPFIFRYLL